MKLGLGLITSREIVTNLGGTIDIQSTVGKGTTFVIQLPTLQKGAS
jgi:signal transduction histidine kinase